jgi:hypothetical protein
MRTLVALAALSVTLGGSFAIAAPASAHGDRERLAQVRQDLLAEGEGTPLLSGNIQHLKTLPGQVAISGCFLTTAPYLVTSGVDSVRVWDVSDATDPTVVGVLPQVLFENEAMNCGERRTSTGTQRFALIGVDSVAAAPTSPEHVNVGGGELRIVDVTDPTNPVVRSTAPGTTSTHTVACVQETDCTYAYSAGDSNGKFSIFDLRNLDRPVEVDSDPGAAGVQPFTSPTAGHKWNFDAAGIGTHTGWGGSSMWNVSRPRNPQLITTTGAAGRGDDPTYAGYNDFIHHNSFRPNADRFKPRSSPSFAHGNVLLVTEEDYEQTDCSQAGSFQAWHVKRLNGAPSAIVPLDKVELSDLGNFPLPRGTFCSAHWFDYLPGGIVAVGFYGGGTQLIDARNPRDLKSYGYALWGASEVWDNMWVPVYDARGRQTGRKSNVLYAIDLVRGLDVYSVDVPGDGRGAEPSTEVTRRTTAVERAADGVVPIGLVGGAALLTLFVRLTRRRGRVNPMPGA